MRIADVRMGKEGIFFACVAYSEREIPVSLEIC